MKVHAPAAKAAKASAERVCVFFQSARGCLKGKACNFKHSEKGEVMHGECFVFERTGGCKYGEKCKFKHVEGEGKRRKKNEETKTCFNCREKGHVAAECEKECAKCGGDHPVTSCEVIEEEGREKAKEQGRKGKGKKERGKKDESRSESEEEEEEEEEEEGEKKKKKDTRKAMSLLNKRRYGLSAQKKMPGADSESESEEERLGRAYLLKEVSNPVKKGVVEEEFEINLRAAQRFCDQLLDTSDSDEDEMEKEKV